MMEKWDSVADTVPTVVERLQALKDLHEQGTSPSIGNISVSVGHLIFPKLV